MTSRNVMIAGSSTMLAAMRIRMKIFLSGESSFFRVSDKVPVNSLIDLKRLE